MFLKDFLSKLVFPNYCNYCSRKLKPDKIYCIDCQKVLLQNFELQETLIDPFYGKIYPLFFPSKVSKNLIYSDRYAGLICDFFVIKLHSIINFYPDYIYLWKSFATFGDSDKRQRCHDFQWAVSKRLKKPLKKAKYIFRKTKEKKQVLVVASNMAGLNQYRKELKALKENPHITLQALVAISPGNFT